VAEIEILPRIHVLNGEAVYEEDGEYLPIDVNATEAIGQLIKSHGKVLIVDMNGVRSNRPRLDVIKRFEKQPVWVDGGVRVADYAIDIFIGGAEKAILRTETLASMNELRKAHELSDQLIFQVDVYEGRTIGMEEFQMRSPVDLLGEVATIGIRVGLYIEKGRSVPNPSILQSLPDDFELYFGILQPSDIARFKDSGIKGIVVDAKELL